MQHDEKQSLTERKYRLPYHWMRDPLHGDSLPYFGYIEHVLEALPPAPARVLDAGCGDGRLSAELVGKSYEVLGVERLEHLVGYAGGLVPEGRFIVGDLRDPQLAERLRALGPFDAAVLMEVYEHVPPEDCGAVLANLRAVIRPRGRLIISVPSLELPKSQLHYRHFDEAMIHQELQAHGFTVERVARQDCLGGWRTWMRSPAVERFLNNGWLQPVALKRVRRYVYRHYVNRAAEGRPCGRFIVTARATEEA